MLRSASNNQKEKIKYGSFELDVSKVCTEKPIQAKLSFIVMLTICSVMLLLGLTACIVMLFRKHKRKQRPFTMTTLVGQNPNLTIDPNLTMDPNALAIQNNQIPPGYLAAPIAANSPVMATNQPAGSMMIANPQLAALQRQPNHQMMMQQHPSFRQHAIGSSRSEFENEDLNYTQQQISMV